jgi:hypothetical protein
MTNTLRIRQTRPPLLRPTHAARSGSRTHGAGRVTPRCLLIAIDANAAPDQASFHLVTAAAVFSTCSMPGTGVAFERRRCNRTQKRQVRQLQ